MKMGKKNKCNIIKKNIEYLDKGTLLATTRN